MGRQRAIPARMTRGRLPLVFLLFHSQDGSGLLSKGNGRLTAGTSMSRSGVEAEMAVVASVERV